MTIWKFPIELDDEQEVTMPKGAQVVSVNVQHGSICLWAVCDPEATKEPRTIFIRGTGHPMPFEPYRFIGTVLTVGGELVWHIFEGATK